MIEAITRRTTQAYHDDMAALCALPPTVEPRATQHIFQMVAMIEALIDKGHAYAADGHVLFSVPSMPDYGALSRLDREALNADARIDVPPYKKQPAHLVLWKPHNAAQPGWERPWGAGRPGLPPEATAKTLQHPARDSDATRQRQH